MNIIPLLVFAEVQFTSNINHAHFTSVVMFIPRIESRDRLDIFGVGDVHIWISFWISDWILDFSLYIVYIVYIEKRHLKLYRKPVHVWPRHF